MQPSIGRIVHYNGPEGDGPHAALVVKVHSASCVDLQIFPQDGDPLRINSVVDTEHDSKGRWSWPPRA
jgi:hypothetical protein